MTNAVVSIEFQCLELDLEGLSDPEFVKALEPLTRLESITIGLYSGFDLAAFTSFARLYGSRLKEFRLRRGGHPWTKKWDR